MAEVRRAYVLDGIVQAVYQDDEAVIAEKLAPIAEHLIDCPPEVQPNWLWIGDAFVDPITLLPPPSVRQLRRAAYFDALRVEGGDDQITVLGDQVDKILAQVGLMKGILDILVQQLANVSPEIRRSASFAALLSAGSAGTITPELAALAAKIQAIKVAIPKAG